MNCSDCRDAPVRFASGVGRFTRFGAQPHPLNASWLVALFPWLPLNLQQQSLIISPGKSSAHHHASGHIAVACSRDGRHWSPPQPLVDCAAHFHSTHRSWRMGALPVHHSVQVTGGQAYVWVQEDIAGMERPSCFTSTKCATRVRRYRLNDDTVLRRCMSEEHGH